MKIITVRSNAARPVVYEEGRFVQVPTFSRERAIALPEPHGTHPQ